MKKIFFYLLIIIVSFSCNREKIEDSQKEEERIETEVTTNKDNLSLRSSNSNLYLELFRNILKDKLATDPVKIFPSLKEEEYKSALLVQDDLLLKLGFLDYIVTSKEKGFISENTATLLIENYNNPDLVLNPRLFETSFEKPNIEEDFQYHLVYNILLDLKREFYPIFEEDEIGFRNRECGWHKLWIDILTDVGRGASAGATIGAGIGSLTSEEKGLGAAAGAVVGASIGAVVGLIVGVIHGIQDWEDCDCDKILSVAFSTSTECNGNGLFIAVGGDEDIVTWKWAIVHNFKVTERTTSFPSTSFTQTNPNEDIKVVVTGICDNGEAGEPAMKGKINFYDYSVGNLVCSIECIIPPKHEEYCFSISNRYGVVIYAHTTTDNSSGGLINYSFSGTSGVNVYSTTENTASITWVEAGTQTVTITAIHECTGEQVSKGFNFYITE